jgi:carbon-monoxide dehydrogenase medium subunit
VHGLPADRRVGASGRRKHAGRIVIPAGFEYVRPASVDEALEALSEPDAKAIAGGHSLVPMMKLRIARPSRLVDIAGLDFRGVRNGGGLAIGALTTYDELTGTAWPHGLPDALRECADSVGDVQVRNAGTVGGSIAHGDPASDFAAAVLAFAATLRLRSTSGTRELAAEDFFLGPFATALEPQELLTEIVIAEPAEGTGSAYVSVDDRASGYPITGAAVTARVDGDRFVACTIGVTGFSGHPFRPRALEAALLADGAAGAAALALEHLPDGDVGVGDADLAYRRQIAAVVVSRALDRAVARARRGGPG